MRVDSRRLVRWRAAWAKRSPTSNLAPPVGFPGGEGSRFTGGSWPRLPIFLEAVIAAFEVCVILDAWQQHDGMADTCDLAAIIDEEGLY